MSLHYLSFHLPSALIIIIVTYVNPATPDSSTLGILGILYTLDTHRLYNLYKLLEANKAVTIYIIIPSTKIFCYLVFFIYWPFVLSDNMH